MRHLKSGRKLGRNASHRRALMRNLARALFEHGRIITTVRDLVIRTDEELLEVRNFGETTLREVKAKLGERGLHLGMKLATSLRR